MNDITNTPASRILEAMKALNMSGYQVQKELGLANGHISHWRRGVCQPSDKAVDQFCDKYKINKNWVLTGIGRMNLTRKSYTASVQDQLKELRTRIEGLEVEVTKLRNRLKIK